LDELNLLITAIGAIVLFLGLVSDYFRRNWWTSDPLTALVLGIILGPAVLGFINPTAWGLPKEHLLEQTARFTMAIGLMGVALRLPQQYFVRHWKPLAILLGLVMPLMWIASGLLVYWILRIPFWEAMLVGAAITPTDPIVSNSIVTGVVAEDNLPHRIRHIISAESGVNDGLAYPFVVLCILLLEKTTSGGKPLTEENLLPYWLTHVVLWEVGGAVVFGIVFGYIAGRLPDCRSAATYTGSDGIAVVTRIFVFQESYAALPLGLTVIVSFGLGQFFCRWFRRAENVNLRHAMLIVALSWAIVPLPGMIPFMAIALLVKQYAFIGSFPWLDSLFQWTSALTTCGFKTVKIQTWSSSARLLMSLAITMGVVSGSTFEFYSCG
jgi:hypothetical protein